MKSSRNGVILKIRNIPLFQELFFVVLVYFLLTIGQASYAIKFNIPWFGTNDFSSYYLMAQNPFDNSAGNPWHANRVLTPFLAWVLLKLNLFLRTDNSAFIESYSSIENTVYDANVLFSLITINYIALLISSLVLIYILKEVFVDNFTNRILIYSVPLLLFLTPATNFSILAGMTEGVSVLIICILLLSIKKRNYKIFLLVLILSIFQRELIPLFIFFVVFNMRKDGFGPKWIFPPVLAFLISIINIYIRDISAAGALRIDIAHVLNDFSLYNITAAIVYLNLMVLYFILVVVFPKDKQEIKQYVPILFFIFSLLVLYFIHPVGIQNLMRMLSLTNPLMILLFVSKFVNIRFPTSSRNILVDRELTISK